MSSHLKVLSAALQFIQLAVPGTDSQLPVTDRAQAPFKHCTDGAP